MKAPHDGRSYVAADRTQPVYDTTVGGILVEAAARFAARPALVEGTAHPPDRRRWTYMELLEAATGAARALLAHFAPGERVALWAPNIPEWVILEFGAGLAGLTLVAVNPVYRSAELRYVLAQSRSAGLL